MLPFIKTKKNEEEQVVDNRGDYELRFGYNYVLDIITEIPI